MSGAVIFRLKDGSKVRVKYTKEPSFNVHPGKEKRNKVDYLLLTYTSEEQSILASVDLMHNQWKKYKDLYDKGDESDLSLSVNPVKKGDKTEEAGKFHVNDDKFNRLIGIAKRFKCLDGPNGLREKLMRDESIRKVAGYYEFIDEVVESQNSDSDDSSADATPKPEQREDSSPIVEGGRRLEIYYSIVRSPKLRERKIADAREKNPQGELVCEACGVIESELGDRYPPGIDVGKIYEVHHIKPLSERNDDAETEPSEVAVLCANCHRMVHINKDVEKNLDDLQKHFDKQPGNNDGGEAPRSRPLIAP